MAICGNCFHLYIVVTKSIQLTSDDLNTIKIYLWKVENMDVCSEPCSGGAGAGVCGTLLQDRSFPAFMSLRLAEC